MSVADQLTKPFLRRVWNRMLSVLARFAPGATSLRPWLHKLRGVRITGRVFIGDDVFIENEYPERIEIQDGAQIAVRSTILAHTRGAGRVIIARDTFIGAACVVSASAGRTLRINEGSVVAAGAVITHDVPPFTLVSMPRPEPIARVTVPLAKAKTYDEFRSGLRPLQPEVSDGQLDSHGR
jgi:UDP-3-O-[3-hydroxymyristoyl] glucosamine N-acyltransferase